MKDILEREKEKWHLEHIVMARLASPIEAP